MSFKSVLVSALAAASCVASVVTFAPPAQAATVSSCRTYKDNLPLEMKIEACTFVTGNYYQGRVRIVDYGANFYWSYSDYWANIANTGTVNRGNCNDLTTGACWTSTKYLASGYVQTYHHLTLHCLAGGPFCLDKEITWIYSPTMKVG